jgi:hypothetical protein
LVHRGTGKYVSDPTLVAHQKRRRRNERLLSSLVLQNDLGATFNLDEVVARSLANPSNRRAELMVRVHGFDLYAKEAGHRAVFLTITCPSRMHARRGRRGDKNPTFDSASSPRASQRYLAQLWSRARAKLARLGVRPYGFRVAEPHHDGTPHWHLLLFIEPSQVEALVSTVRDYALADSPKERGAKQHRFTVKNIDPTKGSATGYIAKYIAKGIDGHGLAEAEGKPSPATEAERVSAWSSTWGIRQFQQIGGPPAGLWRELRRVPGLADSSLIGEAAAAADRGDWCAFVRLIGGPQVSRKDLPFRLSKSFDERPGRYGDPIGKRVVGVEVGNVVFSTRFHTWTILRKAPAQNCTGGADLSWSLAADSPSKTEEGERMRASPPWSSDNNCTRIGPAGISSGKSTNTSAL